LRKLWFPDSLISDRFVLAITLKFNPQRSLNQAQ